MAEHYPTAPQVVDHVDSREICTNIIILGETGEVSVSVPRYATYRTSIVATGKLGKAPGELYCPCDVAIHKDTHHMLVTNALSSRVEVISETGEFLYQLGVGQLCNPWGISVHGDCVYVCCFGDQTVSKLSLNKMCQVRRVGVRDQTTDSSTILLKSQLIQLVVYL